MAKKTDRDPAGEPGKKPRRKAPPVVTHEVVDDSFMAGCDKVASLGGWKDGSIVASGARKLMVGLPVPSLAIEMLIMCTCWPLGRIFQLIGEEGCGKSTLLWEIIRWGMLHGGFAHICENEAKDSAPLRDAILEYNEAWLSRRIRIDWTAAMDDWIERVRRNMDAVTFDNIGAPDEGKKAAAGRFRWRTPYIYVVDSLTATSTRKRQEKTQKSGAPTQDYSREAGMLSDELRTWPGRIRNTSIIFGGTNHMKPDTDRHGNKVPRAPGGKSIKFMESLEIHMDRYPSALDRLDRGGYTVSLFTHKNSFAPDHRRITVDVIWEREETDDPKYPRRRIYWDWHGATTRALLQLMGKSPDNNRAISKVVDIRTARGHRVWSKVLGFPEDSPVDYHTFGRAIDFDRELRQQLRAVIGIAPMNHFRPYTPLAEIYETASPVHDDALDFVYADGADRDLSGFADVADELAGQVRKDRARVAKQRKEEKTAEPEDDFDVFARPGLDD